MGEGYSQGSVILRGGGNSEEEDKLKLQVQIYKLQLKVRGLHDPSL